MSDSVRPHRRQPIRLPHPWDSPGKNTGVGCHFLLQCMEVKSEREVSQSCPTLSDPMDCSLPGSSIHGIFQERVLEWGAIAFSHRPLSLSQFFSVYFLSVVSNWVNCIDLLYNLLICLYVISTLLLTPFGEYFSYYFYYCIFHFYNLISF